MRYCRQGPTFMVALLLTWSGLVVLAGSVGDGLGRPTPASDSATPEAREAASLAQDLRANQAGRTDRSQNHGNEPAYCIRRLSELGAPGVAPLCEAVAVRGWEMAAIQNLAAMFHDEPGVARRPQVDVGALGQADLRALSQVVPAIKASASQTPEKQPGDREACLSLLLSIAPRVQPALPALTDLAATDPLSVMARARLAVLLAAADPATRRKFEAASRRGGEGAKAVVRLMEIWALPPADAAKQIDALDPAQKSAVLTALPGPDKVVVPVLVELLADPNIDDWLLRRRGAAAPAAIRQALKHPDARVRFRAAIVLADDASSPVIETLVDGLAACPPELQGRVQDALRRAGDAVVPPAIDRTHAQDAPVRAATARALGWIADPVNRKVTDPKRTEVARALTALLPDVDPAVRRAAMISLGQIGPTALPAIVEALKTMPDATRRQLASAATEAAEDRSTAPGPFWPESRPRDVEPFVAAIDRLRKDPDPAVHDAAADVLRARDVALAAHASRSPPGPADPKQAAFLEQASAPAADVNQRVAALQKVELDAAPALADGVGRLLADPAPDVRVEAARRLLAWRGLLGSPAVFARVLDMPDHDPSRDVRGQVQYRITGCVDQLVQARTTPAQVAALARDGNDESRRIAATLMGAETYQRAVLMGPEPDDLAAEIRRLTTDASARVRAAAARAAVNLCHVPGVLRKPGSSQFTLVGELLHSKRAEVRAAALEGLLFIPREFVAELAGSDDPQVRAAALLMLEQPAPGPASKRPRRAPFDAAAAALSSPSHEFREMAARSLLNDDPADPTRHDRGIQTLVQVANDSANGENAIDALSALVPIYCGLTVPDPATHRFIYSSNGGSMPKNLPVPWPVYLTRLVQSALTGPVPSRINVIRQIGASEPKFLAGRWDLFHMLLDDPDPAIRAEAFAAARAVTFKAAAAKGVAIPSPRPTTSPANSPAGH